MLDIACLGGMQQPADGMAKLMQHGGHYLQNTADDAPTNSTSHHPAIASYDNFYITLTTELADDISLRHTVLTSSILHHVH